MKTSSVVSVGAVALTGIYGTKVQVETALSSQLPGIRLIGLPDTALGEAKQRIRLAAQSSGYRLASRMIVINLSPAALPKHGSSFDLAIALGVIAVSGDVNRSQLAEIAHIGELGLDGTLRRPMGLFTSVLAAQESGYTTVMVPAVAAAEARLVPNISVIPVNNLREAAGWHNGANLSSVWETTQLSNDRATTEAKLIVQCVDAPGAEAHCESASVDQSIDMADLIGQSEAVEAFVVAAAGRHHISITGPPGAGKSMITARLHTILPDLSTQEALKVTRIAALGDTEIEKLQTVPHFESPHHTSTLASIIGGMVGNNIQPGAVTRASHGVLFLDESPEFSRQILEALRQPLESRTIQLHRARSQMVLPAGFLLVLASNPCPCGYAAQHLSDHNCECGPATRIRYARRISGPLRDRIDVRCEVNRVSNFRRITGYPERTASSRSHRHRVSEARRTARDRLSGTPWQVNAEVPGVFLRTSRFRLSRAVTTVLDRALARGGVTLRGYDRVLRVAWTVADLNGSVSPKRDDIAYALTLRGGC